MATKALSDEERLHAANLAVIRTTALLDAMDYILGNGSAGEFTDALMAMCHFARETANEAHRTLYE
jgi:hypothetical protein